MNLSLSKPLGVLFVCTGNICRSPTAEAVFRHEVRKAGLEHAFRIDSAGTHGYHVGDPPDHRSIATALARGVDMRDLRARKIKESDFNEFEYILAMDSGHYSILERFRGSEGRLAYYLDRENAGVPDPYYGGQRDFDHVYDLIERRTAEFLAFLIHKHDLKTR